MTADTLTISPAASCHLGLVVLLPAFQGVSGLQCQQTMLLFRFAHEYDGGCQDMFGRFSEPAQHA